MDPRGEMNRFFENMFGGLTRPWVQQGDRLTWWSPTVDVVSREGNLVIRADLPGVKLEDVEITLDNDVLTISGERKVEREEDGDDYRIRERSYGSFRRSMTLPDGVDEEMIHARFEDGVLEVTVEGAAAVEEPKRIQILGPGS